MKIKITCRPQQNLWLNKNTFKLLGLSLFINNFSAYSSLATSNIEIPNRYQTLEGEYITIDDSTEGELHEIEIFGNTVQDENNLEDIQSVGDLYVDDNGNPILDKQGREQYKIDITSSNSYNLFLNHEKPIDSSITIGDIDILKINNGYKVKSKKSSIYQNATLIINNIKPNTTYRLTANAINHNNTESAIYIQGLGDGHGGANHYYTTDYSIDATFTTGNTQDKITVFLYNTRLAEIGDVDFVNFTLMESENYTQLKEDTTTILLPTQLQKVGDIADRLYWDNDKKRYVIEKNIIDFQLSKSNVSSVVLRYYTYEENQLSGEILLNIDISLGIGKSWNTKLGILTNKYKGIPKKTMDIHSDKEYIFLNDGPSTFGFMLNKSRLGESPTSQDVLNYIFEDEEIYVLTLKNEPEIIETNITSKLKIPTYEGKTHIYVQAENGVSPTLKVTVDRLSQVAKNAIEEAKVNPTTENISLARIYINMLPESTYKDQLQEQLSEVFNSEITLDKKTASANLDIYIKSENMLSMSLDTNSVTFDNYSGVEPVELKGATTLSISSSLPYDIKAYMPTNISNADGSETINMQFFNIKEGSVDDYQQFTDNTTALVLKADCPSVTEATTHKIDMKLDSNESYKPDVYKTVVKFEAVQK